jgi:hypothetical protein
MESNLLSSAAKDSSAEAVPAAQQSSVVDALAELRKAIAADCGIAPAEYLQEIRVAAGGE